MPSGSETGFREAGFLPYPCNIAPEPILVKCGTKSPKRCYLLDVSLKYVIIKNGTLRLNIANPAILTLRREDEPMSKTTRKPFSGTPYATASS